MLILGAITSRTSSNIKFIGYYIDTCAVEGVSKGHDNLLRCQGGDTYKAFSYIAPNILGELGFSGERD